MRIVAWDEMLAISYVALVLSLCCWTRRRCSLLIVFWYQALLIWLFIFVNQSNCACRQIALLGCSVVMFVADRLWTLFSRTISWRHSFNLQPTNASLETNVMPFDFNISQVASLESVEYNRNQFTEFGWITKPMKLDSTQWQEFKVIAMESSNPYLPSSR